MGSNVDQTALGALLPKDLQISLRADEQFCPRQNHADRVNFLRNRGRLSVRDAKNHRGAARVSLLPAALCVDAGARRIGNSVSVNEVLSAVEKRVEWHVMEQFVRDHNQVLSLQLGAEDSQQFRVEPAQMREGGFQHRLLKSPDIILPEPE